MVGRVGFSLIQCFLPVKILKPTKNVKKGLGRSGRSSFFYVFSPLRFCFLLYFQYISF
nr:MAG TPA: hypothetical protein [Caudoviricetes sp.]